MGVHREGAVAVRTAAPMAVTFFGIRRASEVAKFSISDVGVGAEAGVADLKVNRHNNDQSGLGQLPHLLAAKTCGEASPCPPLFGLLWPRSWAETHRDHSVRMSKSTAAPRRGCVPDALLVELAIAKIWLRRGVRGHRRQLGGIAGG